MDIMNVGEIESGLRGLANDYPSLATMVALPEPTYERQTSYALVIGKRPLCRASGVMITSGMHAREWGGPDICIYFAADLLEAYAAGSDLVYQNKSFSAASVRNMIERMTIVIFPCVNPDGVRFSHTGSNGLWRKNRNLANSTPGDARTVGVDNCRNFDFLWDYETAFAPAAIWEGMGSKNNWSEQYHGPKAFSEPETRNVRWLLDQHPQVRHYLDLHSHAGFVIYPWGADENQYFNYYQNFRNIGWNGKRGVPGPPYGEYMCWFEKNRFKSVTASISAAIFAVRGTAYGAYQLFLMPAIGRKTYCTSGASFDWVYSRHLTDRSKRKVWGYGIEFNNDPNGYFNITGAQLEDMVPDVSAGLAELCRRATPGFWEHLFFCRLGWPF